MTEKESAAQLRQAMFQRGATVAKLTKRLETIGQDDIILYRARFEGASQASGISDKHIIVINLGKDVAADCRVNSSRLVHRSGYGNVTLIPAGSEWSAQLAGSTEKVVLAIPVERVAFAAAQADRAPNPLRPRLRGEDDTIFSIVREMWLGTPAPSPAGWQSLADELADHLATGVETVSEPSCPRRLEPAAISRINKHLETILADPVLVDSLADVAGEGISNFPRIFRRTFGISPHQYIVRLRLRYARRMIARGWPIAEAAYKAGFSHQSHLTNWMRRIYGVTPGGLLNSPKSAETCKMVNLGFR